MVSFNSRTTATRDDWKTPKHIFQPLGVFDFDPAPCYSEPYRCASSCPPENESGLTVLWSGRVWLNPPYGDQCKLWMERMAEHGNGIALIPPRLGSKWFHEIVFPHCSSIFALKGRIAFIHAVGNTPISGNNADSLLIAYGEENTQALHDSKLPGFLMKVRP